MEFKKVNKTFKVVGMKKRGAFDNFGNEVPVLAQQVLNRSNEIQNHTGTEIALYEPKRDVNHLEGSYFVGLIVSNYLTKVPTGMEYIERTNDFVTTRGQVTRVGELHQYLLHWAEEQGYNRDLDSSIVETYHPIAGGDEEVKIYLPIHS
ncbi:GyrI-like domain-containing protein [Paenisporosarcina sp. NPDC076898]|uniref:GyrI-like domain-containing protein n=1 Tax=unclassified Paenisporosarcina TaxID=2642018 RepID=UPI003D01C692